jgi:transcriptional regulator GlxA family with amidase domain
VSRRPTFLHVELLTGEDWLDGPAAAVVDVLRVIHSLAQMRGARHAPVSWQWTAANGRAVRRAPAAPARRVRRPDAIVASGWAARSGAHLSRLVARDRGACARLRAVHDAGGHVVALYTGVALAGEAGLLEGRRAVVPWPFIPSVLRHAPQAQLVDGEAWVEDGRTWTADSPALATELALEVLQALGCGELVDAARAVLLHSAQRQRLAKAVARDHLAQGGRVGPGTLERARRWLEEHLHEPYRQAELARAASTSERSLLRHFRASFDQTPLQMLHAMRVTRARMLLETTYLPLDVVAERCGWRDPAMLREVFRRATGMTPAAYRERHRLRAKRREWGRDLAR